MRRRRSKSAGSGLQRRRQRCRSGRPCSRPTRLRRSRPVSCPIAGRREFRGVRALFEEFVYDEDGNPLTGNFAPSPFPTAADLPSFELVSMETPTPINELGVKGIGESGTIGATPAVQNAVVDALQPFGVRHV